MKGVSSVQKRGMILVAVPLALQLVFIVVAFNLLARLNEEIVREMHSQELVRKGFSISRESIASLVSENLIRRSGGAAQAVTDKDAAVQIERGSKSLKDYCAELQANSKQAQNAIALHKSAELLKAAVLVNASSTKFTSEFAKLANQFRLLTLAPRCAEKFAAVIATEEQEGKAFAVDAQKSVNGLISAALITVIASIVVSACLGLFYAYSIRKPLEHLSENGMLLASRKELLPSLQSGDEFADLDRLLHTVSDSVNVALLREQAVIENAGDMICSLDAEGRVHSVNESGETLLGRPKQSLINSKLSELSVEDQADFARESVNNAIKAGSSQTFELPMRIADGSVIDTLWSCLWSPAHRLLFCVVHNVTEQKKAERLRDDFTQMISQDLRQPLIDIYDCMRMIQKEHSGDLSATVAKDVAVIDRNVNRLVDLVNDLLDFQKLNAGTLPLAFAQHDLAELCRDAASLVQPFAQEREVRLETPSGSLYVHCDGKKLLQALTNLLANAIKYSPSGGSVIVELQDSDKSVQIQINDQGPGVPDDFKHAIFEPFQQAPSAIGKVGTGLGLAICKSIAESHDGSIRVIDGPEGGSIFCMEISKAPTSTPIQ